MTPEQLIELNETTRTTIVDVADRGVAALESVTTDLTLDPHEIGVGLNWSGCSYNFQQEGNPPIKVNWSDTRNFAVEGAGDLRERALQAAEAFIAQNGEEWKVTLDSSNDEQRRMKVSRPGMSVRFTATMFPEGALLSVDAVSSCTPVPDDTRERWPQWS